MITKSPGGPVFIVGAPRSGTTLLQYMLRSHPSLSLPTGESHFIIPYYRDAGHYENLASPQALNTLLADMRRRNAEFIETDLHGIDFDEDKLGRIFFEEGHRNVREVLTALFQRNAEGEGKQRWGDKTPYYILHLSKLLHWWPDAQIIHVVRDGRDVALSLFARQHDFGVYNTYFAAKYWEHYVEVGHETGRQLPVSQYLEIRYEDLIRAPHETLQKICAYLGIIFSENVVDFRKSSMAGKTPLLQQPIQAGNAEKWRTEMNPAQIRIFEGAVGPTLERFHYPLTTPAVRHPLPLRAAWRWHNQLTKHWHAWRRHG